jgi:hypothetical protein
MLFESLRAHYAERSKRSGRLENMEDVASGDPSLITLFASLEIWRDVSLSASENLTSLLVLVFSCDELCNSKSWTDHAQHAEAVETAL